MKFHKYYEYILSSVWTFQSQTTLFRNCNAVQGENLYLISLDQLFFLLLTMAQNSWIFKLQPNPTCWIMYFLHQFRVRQVIVPRLNSQPISWIALNSSGQNKKLMFLFLSLNLRFLQFKNGEVDDGEWPYWARVVALVLHQWDFSSKGKTRNIVQMSKVILCLANSKLGFDHTRYGPLSIFRSDPFS